jgi:ribosomal protein L37E
MYGFLYFSMTYDLLVAMQNAVSACGKEAVPVFRRACHIVKCGFGSGRLRRAGATVAESRSVRL